VTTHAALEKTRWRKQLRQAGISIERMPMLHVIFDQMTNLCAESLRHCLTELETA